MIRNCHHGLKHIISIMSRNKRVYWRNKNGIHRHRHSWFRFHLAIIVSMRGWIFFKLFLYISEHSYGQFVLWRLRVDWPFNPRNEFFGPFTYQQVQWNAAFWDGSIWMLVSMSIAMWLNWTLTGFRLQNQVVFCGTF